MPYTRPIRRFYLTPSAVPTFVISVLPAVLAVVAVYGHIPELHSVGGFTLLLIATSFCCLGRSCEGFEQSSLHEISRSTAKPPRPLHRGPYIKAITNPIATKAFTPVTATPR
jgi:hypothetical protein